MWPVKSLVFLKGVRVWAGWAGLTCVSCCCAQVQMPSSLEYQPVECSLVVNAAGASSAKLAEMLGVAAASNHALAGIPLPVEPRKRSAVCLLRLSGLAAQSCLVLTGLGWCWLAVVVIFAGLQKQLKDL